MVPRTSDGRVLFVIPWHGHAVAGTTDTPVDAPSLEPKALDEEIEFILETAGRYLSRPPTRADVLAVYVGLRPLVKSEGEGKTSALSRDHVIHVDTSGLLTITGGKWTTYRHMAEDCVDHAITLGRLRDEACTTKNLRIHGYMESVQDRGWRDSLTGVWGGCGGNSRAGARTSGTGESAACGIALYRGGGGVGGAGEMARSVEDVLARRTRALFLNARAAVAMAEPVAQTAGARNWDAMRPGRRRRWWSSARWRNNIWCEGEFPGGENGDEMYA